MCVLCGAEIDCLWGFEGFVEARLKLRVQITLVNPPANTLLEPKWPVEDAGRVSFAQNTVLIA